MGQHQCDRRMREVKEKLGSEGVNRKNRWEWSWGTNQLRAERLLRAICVCYLKSWVWPGLLEMTARKLLCRALGGIMLSTGTGPPPHGAVGVFQYVHMCTCLYSATFCVAPKHHCWGVWTRWTSDEPSSLNYSAINKKKKNFNTRWLDLFFTMLQFMKW